MKHRTIRTEQELRRALRDGVKRIALADSIHIERDIDITGVRFIALKDSAGLLFAPGTNGTMSHCEFVAWRTPERAS